MENIIEICRSRFDTAKLPTQDSVYTDIKSYIDHKYFIFRLQH